MCKITILMTLAVFGAANAGVVGPYGLGLGGLGVGHLGLAGVGPYGVGLGGLGVGLGGLGVGHLGLAGVGLGHAGVVGPLGAIGASGAIASNPGGTIAAAHPGANWGATQVGPKTAATVVGVQAVLNGPSATLHASTGAVKGAAQAGANIHGIPVPGHAVGGAIPASTVAVQKVPIHAAVHGVHGLGLGHGYLG